MGKKFRWRPNFSVADQNESGGERREETVKSL